MLEDKKQLEKRKCNKCNKAFQPKSEINFFCNRCGTRNINSSGYPYGNNVFRRDLNDPNKVNLLHKDNHIDFENGEFEE